MTSGIDAARGRQPQQRPTIPQMGPVRQSPPPQKLTGQRGVPVSIPSSSQDMDMTWPQQRQLSQHQQPLPKSGKGTRIEDAPRVSVNARDVPVAGNIPVAGNRPISTGGPRTMSPLSELKELKSAVSAHVRGSSPQPQRAVRRSSQSNDQQGTSTLERLLSGMEDMRASMQRDMNHPSATGEFITKNAVTALLENLRSDSRHKPEGSECPSSSFHSEHGSHFSTGLPVDVSSESTKVLTELASIISDERRLHEESLPAACEVLRDEAKKVLSEIERVGSIVHRRFQEETVPAACDVLKSEVQKAVFELKSVAKTCSNDSEALRAEVDKGIAILREATSTEKLSLAKDSEHIKVEAKKAVSEMIDQEHRLQKDLIRAELTKATSQLKEVVAESAKSLAEAVPREREILRSESEKAITELRNFVDYENRLRQEVLLKEVAQQAESEARLEQHWSNLVQEEVAHHVTLSLANFEGRLAMLETSNVAAPTPNLDHTNVFNQDDLSRLATLEAQVQSALSFGARAGSLEARTASLEQQVQTSSARVPPVEGRIASLEQQVQAVVASTARAAPLEDVRDLRANLAKMRGPTEDVALLVADMTKLRPLIQDVSDIRSDMMKMRDLLLPDQIRDIRCEVTKLQDVLLPEQIKEVKFLVEQEQQKINNAFQNEATKHTQLNVKLQSTLDAVAGVRTKIEEEVGKLQVEITLVRSNVEELRAKAAVQRPLENICSEQHEQKSRLVNLAQALATIEDTVKKELGHVQSGAALMQRDVQQIQKSLKDEKDDRLSAVARLETSVADVLKEAARLGRRTSSLHQLIMHGNKATDESPSPSVSGSLVGDT